MKEVKDLKEKFDANCEDFEASHEKAMAGNKSAATKARAATNEMTKLLKEYRAASIKAFK